MSCSLAIHALIAFRVWVDIQRTNWALRAIEQPLSNGGLCRDYFITDYTSLFVFDSTFKLVIQRRGSKSPD